MKTYIYLINSLAGIDNQRNEVGFMCSQHGHRRQHFTRKRTHKATYVSPEHVTENQIEHICVNKKFGSSTEEVGIKREADITLYHHMVIDKLEHKPKAYWTNEQATPENFNTAFLQNANKLSQSNIDLSNKF